MTDQQATFRSTTQQRLLACAATILETEGMAAVQARRVAREADCAVGTLYNVFGDIDGLLLAVNAETLGKLGEAVRAGDAETAGLDLRQQLNGLALVYMRFALANRHRWEAVFKHRLPAGRETPASYLEDQARLLAVIEAPLATVLPESERRAAAARALFGAVHGIVALALDDRLGGQLKQELEAQLEFITDVTSRGLLANAVESREHSRK